ncbi:MULTISPECIES: alpha/beta fold hydrolase [unclassified Sphingobium]|uniref:alpha/beta fold hydrolase n=1 Tax=unclassified Sphingobium TaxID=2611147 RepID=UPI0022244813|nr:MULTISPECIES: alpha/beta hydrolase [unclassified Sphingobium]MCW2395297.1 pimeloyl-ACP methyl ester carboxylesterase [Sphingobium sp. B8D3B]MCW2418811.1 pimeloyl-ACP methyl ester carboxylesterase [Sphingobium sp. B8D3C]
MELVLLHALPFNGSMWTHQRNLIPGRTHTPDLYAFGDTLHDWAAAILERVSGHRLLVVGNSIGGSCALEVAALAPERVAGVVLIGAKAAHRPEPSLRSEACQLLMEQGMKPAWERYWGPLIFPKASQQIHLKAKRCAMSMDRADIAKGVNAFHTRPTRDDLLPQLSCPLICISGEYDIAPGPIVMASQAKAAAEGHLKIIPNCGHYVPFEKPAELNALLRTLIENLDD